MSTTTDTLTMEQAQALPLSPELQAASAACRAMPTAALTMADLRWRQALGGDSCASLASSYRSRREIDAAEVAILSCRAGGRESPLARLAGLLVRRSESLRIARERRETSEAEAAALRLLLTGAEDRLAATEDRLLARGEQLTAVQERLAEAVQDRLLARGATEVAILACRTGARRADQHRQQALSSCESRICELEDTIARLQPLAEAEQQRLDALAAKRSRAAKAAAAKRRRAAAPAKRARLEQRYQELLSQASADLAEGRISDAIHGALARRLGVTRSWVPRWAAKAGDAPREEYVSGYHTTPAGTRVYHPSAYGYRTLYHCAVREIHVGRGWLRRNLRSLCREAAAHR